MILFNALVSEARPGMMFLYQLRWEKRREEGKAMGLETSLDNSSFSPQTGEVDAHFMELK